MSKAVKQAQGWDRNWYCYIYLSTVIFGVYFVPVY